MLKRIAGWTAVGVTAVGFTFGGVALSTNPQHLPAVPQSNAEASTVPSGQSGKGTPEIGSQKRSESHTAPTASEFASAALKEAAKKVSGRPNVYTLWYAKQSFAKDYAASYGGFSASAYKTSAWCAIFASYLTHKLGVETPGDDALASGLAREYRAEGKLKSGPRTGSLAFFDWSGQERLSGIAHVGIVVGWTESSVKVVEANVGGGEGRVRITWRDRSDVVGYGDPFVK